MTRPEETLSGKKRLTAKAAGYMELKGAVKDADCQLVQVAGGVSKQLGCCNKYQPANSAVKQFRCGKCEYLVNGRPRT